MLEFMERMGSAVCHQMAERSFLFDGMQMPLCARCTGIYIGVFFAFFWLFLKKRMQASHFTLSRAVITALAILPVGIDGVGSYLGFWESSQLMRIFSGCLVGAVTPGFLLLAGNSDPKREKSQPVYEKTGEILFLMAAAAGFGFCLLAGVPLFWIGAIISVAGEVLLWGGVVWLLLKNLMKSRKLPLWRISVLISFGVLFLIGGLIP